MHTLGNMKLPPFPCFLSCSQNLQHLLAHHNVNCTLNRAVLLLISLLVWPLLIHPHLKLILELPFKTPVFCALILILTADDPVLYIFLRLFQLVHVDLTHEKMCFLGLQCGLHTYLLFLWTSSLNYDDTLYISVLFSFFKETRNLDISVSENKVRSHVP